VVKKKNFAYALSLSLLLIFSPLAAWGAAVTPERAAEAVAGWLSLGAPPLAEGAGVYGKVEMFGADGEATSYPDALFYAVYLKPAGVVFVPAEDLVEPVVAFQPGSVKYEFSKASPLYGLVAGRLIEEVKASRMAGRRASEANVNQAKWRALSEAAGAPANSRMAGLPAVSDVRVEPFIQSAWGQAQNMDSTALYNCLTPKNYPAGCVATAFGQVMKYFKYPVEAVGAKSFAYLVDNAAASGNIMGGDGAGGAYKWEDSDMPPRPGRDITEQQRWNIGALMHDIGIAVASEYSRGGTGAYTHDAGLRLVDTFKYSSATTNYLNDEAPYLAAIDSNLDAGLPVVLGITNVDPNAVAAHAVVVDGYGYSASTKYHHVNMGWDGNEDVWYALPEIASDFNSINSCVFNIYKSGAGEMVSGRVLDGSGSPLEGVSVYLQDTEVPPAITDGKGIFAFAGVPSDSGLTVLASADARTFKPQRLTVARSVSYGGNFLGKAANVWGLAFVDKFDDLAEGAGGTVTASVTPRDVVADQNGLFDVRLSSPVKTAFVSVRGGPGDVDAVYSVELDFSGDSGKFAAALPGGTYTFGVMAVDAEGNVSVSESSAEITSLVTSLPGQFVAGESREYSFSFSVPANKAGIHISGPGETMPEGEYEEMTVRWDGRSAYFSHVFPNAGEYVLEFWLFEKNTDRWFFETHNVLAVQGQSGATPIPVVPPPVSDAGGEGGCVYGNVLLAALLALSVLLLRRLR
jgi:hypothetical protein